MIWFFIAFVVALYVLYYVKVKDDESWRASIACYLFVWGILSLFAFPINMLCSGFKPIKDVEWFNCPLHSIHDKSGVEGRFFLGTGYVGSTQNYFCYLDYSSYFLPKSFPMDNVFIVENDKGYAHYTEWAWEPDNSGFSWLLSVCDNPKAHTVSSRRVDVPRGSVDNTFSLGK